jgi:hypothetical protein
MLTKFSIILAGAMATAFVALPPANAQSVKGVEITEYGLYTVDETKGQRDANGVLHSSSTNVRHAATTTTVPAQIGVHFGFRYHISGQPAGEQIVLKKVVIYPEGGIKSPKSPSPLLKNEYELTRKIGETAYTDYAFDDPWELVPGTWTMQLWDGDRKLAEKIFVVTAP